MATEDQDILDQIAELRRQRAAEMQAMQSDNNPLGLIVSGALGGLADVTAAGGGLTGGYTDKALSAYQSGQKGQRDMRLKALEGSGEEIKALNALAQSRQADRKTAGLYEQQEKLARLAEAGRDTRARLDREAGKYSAGAQRAEEKAAQQAAKKEEKELALAVPGFSRTGEVLPKTEEAQKLREATADAEQLTQKLDRMQQLVKQYGAFEYGGPGGTEMKSLAREIQLLAKSPNMYGLGVLAGPDLMILEDITADPESFKSLFTYNPSRQTQITAQLDSIKNKLASKAKSLGYIANATESQKTTPPPVDNSGSIFSPTANASSAPAAIRHPDPALEAERQALMKLANPSGGVKQ